MVLEGREWDEEWGKCLRWSEKIKRVKERTQAYMIKWVISPSQRNSKAKGLAVLLKPPSSPIFSHYSLIPLTIEYFEIRLT